MFSIGNKKSLSLLSRIILPVLAISTISLLTLYFSNANDVFSTSSNFFKQIIFISLGLVGYYFISKLDYELLKFWQILVIVYVVTAILLIITIIIGEARGNAVRWIEVGGIQIQPSEIAKYTVIFVSAYVMEKLKYVEWLRILIALILSLPMIFLIYIQPSGSIAIITTVLMGITVFMFLENKLGAIILMLIASLNIAGIVLVSMSISIGFIFIIASIFIAIFGFFSTLNIQKSSVVIYIGTIVIGIIISSSTTFIWNNILEDHHRNRINTYIQEMTGQSTSSDAVWQVNQSKITIGSGQIFGKGWGNGTQSTRMFLPEHNTDFIFAAYAEQTGLFGILILFALYLALYLSIIVNLYSKSLGKFEIVIVTTILFKFLIEITINLGTNTGIMPPTGIPLPFMSYGGTITLLSFFSLGLIQSIIDRNSIDNSNILN